MSQCTHLVRSIILYLACIMSFIWRMGVTGTTPPGLSDTGLLVTIRIVMSVVLGVGMLYGLLIMTTFKRYGMVMDKAWKHRIDEWIAEKCSGNLDSYAYPTVDGGSYPLPRRRRRRSSSYHRPTPSRYYQPSYGGRYNTVHIPPLSRSSTPSPKPHEYYYTPAPPIIIQWPPPGSPSSSRSSGRINWPGPNQPDSRVPQPSHGGTTSAVNPGATPPTPNLEGPAEEIPPRLIPERTLYPIIESSVISPSEDGDNALGFSSGLANRRSGGDGDDDQVHDDGNRVRFRLPSGSSDISDGWKGIICPRKLRKR